MSKVLTIRSYGLLTYRLPRFFLLTYQSKLVSDKLESILKSKSKSLQTACEAVSSRIRSYKFQVVSYGLLSFFKKSNNFMKLKKTIDKHLFLVDIMRNV